MATITSFRPSISQMSDDELLNHIRTIRALRRMILEKAMRKTRTKKASGKNLSIKDHLRTLNDGDKQKMLQMLLKLKGKSKCNVQNVNMNISES